MESKSWSESDVAFFYTLAYTGFELVVPLGLGLLLDSWLRSTPWLTVAGAGLGLVVGITHMTYLARQRFSDTGRPK